MLPDTLLQHAVQRKLKQAGKSLIQNEEQNLTPVEAVSRYKELMTVPPAATNSGVMTPTSAAEISAVSCGGKTAANRASSSLPGST